MSNEANVDTRDVVVEYRDEKSKTLFEFARPELEDFEDYQEKLVGSKHKKGAAMRELCQVCLVRPDLSELVALFKRQPALPVGIAGAIAKASGSDAEVTVKKD